MPRSPDQTDNERGLDLTQWQKLGQQVPPPAKLLTKGQQRTDGYAE